MTDRDALSFEKGSGRDVTQAKVSLRELDKTQTNPELLRAVKTHWYRSTFTQATILGLCSFLAPGLW